MAKKFIDNDGNSESIIILIKSKERDSFNNLMQRIAFPKTKLSENDIALFNTIQDFFCI